MVQDAGNQAEHGLRWLAAIVESSEDAVVSKTLQGVITSWNPGAERIFGYSAAEVVGRSITVLFPPERLTEEDQLLARIRRGERIEHFETVRVRKDGQRIDISVTLSPIRSAAGDIIGVSKIARDITDRKRLEEARTELLRREQAARRAADEASRMKDEFLATLSHELRTPVNAILGWARLIAADPANAAFVQRGLESIERNARLQVDLISELLDSSRMITGAMRLNVRVIDPSGVLNMALDAVRPAALSKDVKLVTDAPEQTVRVWADPMRLQQICWNLLINAVKFTPPGGRVEASIALLDGLVELRVADNGAGIGPGVLPYIFERFHQGDSSTTRTHGGLGLGLAIVRHLVELHGGTVEARSEGPGLGATFIVRLPAVADAGESPPAERAGGVRLDNVRVLVVDDEEDARELLRAALERAGARVVAAASAPDALAALAMQTVDAIVADLAMPGKDGLELIAEIRALEGARRAPALALTALAQEHDRARALAAGFDRHVAKPVDPLRLPEILADLLAAGPSIHSTR
jgi:PAS domain S-box-containing protein